MRKPALSACAVTLAFFFAMGSAFGGQPLVVKTKDGKFIPAVANEWAKFGDSYRFMLKAGSNAPGIAAEIKDQIAPFAVTAPDDLTLVFKGQDLTEPVLLEKLSGIELGKEKAVGDALAALSDLGDSGGPALTDLSSAGSIRASKKFELPKAEKRKLNPSNLGGQVIEVKPCEPMPTVIIKVTAVPKQGPNQKVFKLGQKLAIRGYYKVTDDTREIDPADKRTRINLKSKDLTPGMEVFGKPFLQEEYVWVMETIEKR